MPDYTRGRIGGTDKLHLNDCTIRSEIQALNRRSRCDFTFAGEGPNGLLSNDNMPSAPPTAILRAALVALARR